MRAKGKKLESHLSEEEEFERWLFKRKQLERVAAMVRRRANWQPGDDARDLAAGLGLRVIPSPEVKHASARGGKLRYPSRAYCDLLNGTIVLAIAEWTLRKLRIVDANSFDLAALIASERADGRHLEVVQ